MLKLLILPTPKTPESLQNSPPPINIYFSVLPPHPASYIYSITL
jgi:hypothetical protein